MTSSPVSQPNKQYSFAKIILIWALSALPMGLLAFVVTPRLAATTQWPLLMAYWVSIIAGLVWQFILALAILRYDGHQLNWQTFAMRLRYQKPVHPRTGRASYRLLWWTLPFIALSAVLQSGIVNLPDIDGWLGRGIQHLPQYDLSGLTKGDYRGAWWILLLFFLTSVFNYVLGEELMYRGILLPKMEGVFGKWDWFFNGVLFGCYHLHKPQVLLSTSLYFGLVFALPSKIFQSSWMAVIIHGLEGLLGAILVLGVILGWS
jgi:membrane protease YdiL (CAAX protease family)